MHYGNAAVDLKLKWSRSFLSFRCMGVEKEFFSYSTSKMIVYLLFYVFALIKMRILIGEVRGNWQLLCTIVSSFEVFVFLISLMRRS